jgi:serine/threonine-protein kinase
MKRFASSEPTHAYSPPFGDHVPSSAPPATRCKVARCGAAGTPFREAITGLLRSRLRLVVLIILLPMVYFLVKNLLDPEGAAQLSKGGSVLFLQLVVTVTVAVLGTVLWSRACLRLRTLRIFELTLFGLMALFFAWLQWSEFCGLVCGKMSQQADTAALKRVLTVGTSIRWFYLIVIYGVFIPNTWRRCLLLCSMVAALPIVLGLVSAVQHQQLDHNMVSGLVDLSILMVTGLAVAVFGTYRLHFLQEKAFTAEQLGQYRLKKKLGSGGMGEVYLAEHTLLRRPCAVKLIRPEQAGNPTNLQRFEREVQTMATLTHWNTVEIFDYGHADNGTFYYVMEYLPGLNLEALVSRYGPLPPGRAVHFLRQVCMALREAHGIGLLHRDIKPSNIIATTRGAVPDVVKLLDFGLVHASGLDTDANRLTVQGTILGSPPYMSPEQAAGKNDLDPRSDVYSLGGVAYFILTGRPPFVRETAMEMLLAHAYEPVEPPSRLRPQVPADLEGVLTRCLAKKKEDRYATVDELEKALAACACATYWTEEDAADWWKEHQGESDTTENVLEAETTLATRARVGAAG